MTSGGSSALRRFWVAVSIGRYMWGWWPFDHTRNFKESDNRGSSCLGFLIGFSDDR